MQYIKEFAKSRSKKIGASEIAACIQHPEKYESLAGYDRTAVTVFEEKTGRRVPDKSGFAAKMGHIAEPAILREFIEQNFDEKTAKDFYRGYMLCELDKQDDGYPNAESFQNTPFLHHTRAETESSISHTDIVAPEYKMIIEAKQASFWSAKRGDDPYKGYDIDLQGGQGVPLRNFFQVHFQHAIYHECYGLQFDKLFIALSMDAREFHSWEIRPDTKIQERLLEIASYMKKCIDKDMYPKLLAMNQGDIKAMYPKLDEDFRIISGDELEKAIAAAKQSREAAEQEKAWKLKKTDAENALSVILKDTKTIRGMIDNEIIDIASWTERAGSEMLKKPESDKTKDGFLKWLKKNDEKTYRYLMKKKYIGESEGSKYVSVKLK